MQATAHEYFGSLLESYDSLIRRAVPRYDEMTTRLLDYLPSNPRSVLELGCGTGNLSVKLAERFPAAAITFVDAAPEMVDITRTRVAAAVAEAARHSYIVQRFEDLQLPPAAFDLVVSSISLHHVEDKARLYRALRRALTTPGMLRFSDQLGGATDFNHDVNWSKWLQFCREPGNCTEAELEQLLQHAAQHDHYTPLPEQFELLQTAGFDACDCVWRNLIWGIVTADVR